MSLIDLQQLPPPDVVESLDFEAVYQQHLALFRQWVPDFDAVLESEPVVKILEVSAYREIQLRARINDAARANLLAFAGGADLEQLAAFYGISKMPDESDERLRLRTQLRIAALAGNGTRELYRLAALSVSQDIVDAAVLCPRPGAIVVAVWIAPGADAGLLLYTVRAALMSDETLMLGVDVSVCLARERRIDVAARLWREPNAPTDLVFSLALEFPAWLESYAQLGRDVPRSWLLSRLHVPGIARVELEAPATNIELADDEFAAPGEITLSDAGVSW
ncbi:MAG: baseplate J/gp47 family protein [Betaproteobacteria bacterium]|nr:baseplate J/gp47 family protein [Betaproteobacteria bacterium]